MKPIDTTVQRACEYDGQAYGQGDYLPLPLVDAMRLANSGDVRLGYRRPKINASEPVKRKRGRPRKSEATA